MAVYRITNRQFEPLAETSFETEKLYERDDLQRMLRDRADLLEEGLFVVAEEYGDWEESNRRIDLLALDGEGRLVVVELKRSDQDSLMDLQAIRYAAMVANMTLDQAIDAHRGYLRERGMDGDADVLIRAHLGPDEAGTRISTANPRIILVSAHFSKELTTSVLWLNQRNMDITCIKLQPYRSENELYIEASQVIPMAAAADYMVRLRNREREAEGQRPYQPLTSEGAEEFQEAIKTARADQRERLERLCGLAVELESHGLARISTRVGSVNTVLRVELPNTSRGLIYVYRNKAGYGYLQFGGSLFDSRAPISKKRIEEIISPTIIGPVSTYWELPEGFLEALRDAYREATGGLSEGAEEEPKQPDDATPS